MTAVKRLAVNNYSFEEVFDIPKLTLICEGFTRFTGMGASVVDLEGNVHVGAGWQGICTQFHRVHPETHAKCIESDTGLAMSLFDGEPYNIYSCKNGLVDVAVPIYLEGNHVANFFTGQFFLEKPNKKFFQTQAKQYEFDEILYMESLSKVSIFEKDKVKKALEYICGLTQLIGELGLEKLRGLEQEKRQRNELERLVELRTLELAHMNSQLEQVNKTLVKQSRTDPLTRVKNRLSFNELYDKEWKRCVRTKNFLSLLMIDIDHFKLFNDRYGHLQGDKCLIQVALQLSRCMQRPGDFVARFGGEEFICVLVDTPMDGAINVAHQISESVAGLAIPHADSSAGSVVSVSIGAITCSPSNALSSQNMIESADNCLYQAKYAGRNQVFSKSFI